MPEPVRIDATTLRQQALASDPAASAWVSANAGSGKTFVLAQRVIRLLLGGVEPSKILCLTYTKAAAAEMANRIFETLAGWVTKPDPALASQLAEITGEAAGPRKTAHARTLFALALDTPGGLKIQTIHAFCEALLHQFPLEANVSGNFEVLDDLRKAELMAQARRAVFGEIDRGETAPELIAAFDRLMGQASDEAIGKALDEIDAMAFRFGDWPQEGMRVATRQLWDRFGLDPDEGETRLMERLLGEAHLSREKLARIADLARSSGSVNDRQFADAAQLYLGALSPKDRFRARNEVFLTQQAMARKDPLTKALVSRFPEFDEWVRAQAQRTENDFRTLNDWRLLKNSESLFILAEAILERYESAKRKRSLVEFADLIERTLNLLTRAEIGPWVRYKLDRGIDHLLIDEAQDTNPQQWEIVRAITSDFHAGEGASRAVRTIFAVGDEKQSIFSFHGADPAKFAEQGKQIAKAALASGAAFNPATLNLSFRSSPDILHAVDTVFSVPENFAGLSAGETFTLHTARRTGDPGEVWLWPILGEPEREEKTEWIAPVDAPGPEDPRTVLARRIAGTIRGWIDRKEKLPGRDSPIRPGDILVLVRKRDSFMTALIRELKNLNLAIAGADRLRLTDHIAIEDLLALGRVALLAEDDLSLAACLKSPLFDCDDADLVELAAGRGNLCLYEHLRRLSLAPESRAGKKAAAILARLDPWLELARTADARAFYARVLGRDGARRAFLARLGTEAGDVLDAFEQAAIDHGRQGGRGLEDFVASLERASPEIKREIDVRRNEIRVLTAHSAKGLEAPVVFLVDPGSEAFHVSHAPSVIEVGDDGEKQFLWVTGGKKTGRDSHGLVEARLGRIRRRAEEEYRRLLYVAMTRAADRLIVCGYHGKRTPLHDHWHSMVSAALGPGAREVLDGKGEIVARIWQSPDETIRAQARERPLREAGAAGPALPEPYPEWLDRPALIELSPPRPLNPSEAGLLLGRPVSFDADNRSSVDFGPQEKPAERQLAQERGIAVHRLLQYLPGIAPGEREMLAARWLERHFSSWPGELRRQSLRQALDVIADGHLAGLFGNEARAEVRIAGTVDAGGRKILVSGQIDRLCVLPEKIVFADYKTNRTVPRRNQDVDPAIRLQMAFYGALLMKIYPGREISGLLVWTQDGSLREFGATEFAAELADLS